MTLRTVRVHVPKSWLLNDSWMNDVKALFTLSMTSIGLQAAAIMHGLNRAM